MPSDKIEKIRKEITNHPSNAWAKDQGWEPIFTASAKSKIVIIGQAPGRLAQESQIPWDDKSGVKLKEWLGVTNEQFYNPDLISLLPMDFYYPGKGDHGDLPPRKEFASMWHPQILIEMTEVKLIVLIGQYAQKYYLGQEMKRNLTETVRAYAEYLPKYFPIVHPSPLNFRWQAINTWFQEEVIPVLQEKAKSLVCLTQT